MHSSSHRNIMYCRSAYKRHRQHFSKYHMYILHFFLATATDRQPPIVYFIQIIIYDDLLVYAVWKYDYFIEYEKCYNKCAYTCMDNKGFLGWIVSLTSVCMCVAVFSHYYWYMRTHLHRIAV